MSSVPPERRGIASGSTSAIWYVGYTMSLNLAIIMMTTVVPFSVVSATISSPAYQTSAANRALFVVGLQRAFLVLAAIDFIAIIPSSLRGDSHAPAAKVLVSPGDRLADE